MAGLAGVASGVDTDALVAKLVEAESGRRTRMTWTQAQITARSTGLAAVQTGLVALRTAVQGLRDLGTWADTQTTESTDARVGVRRTGPAAAGGSTVEVSALARAEQRTYAYTPPSSAGSITVGAFSVALAAGTSLADAVSAVNGAGNAPVYASAVNGALVLTARATGTAAGFTATSAALTEDATRARPGQDAAYRVDGGPLRSSASNVVADGLPGLELTLKGVTATPASVVVGVAGPDADVVRTRVQAFVTAYNAVVTTTRGLTTEERVAGAASAADAAKGVLRADPGLNGLLSGLRQAVSDPQSGATGVRSFADIGVSTGAAGTAASADARAGLLVLDATKLTTALSDPQAVRRLLGGVTGVAGLAQRLEGVVGGQVGANGVLTKRLGAAASDTTALQQSMTREDQRLAAVEARYKAQFSAMETALLNAQSQQAWLEGQIAKLG